MQPPISGGEPTLAALAGDATLLSADRPRPPYAAEPLGPGARVGRYVLKDTLGAGGMGTVFAARDPDLDRRVAIKLLHPHSAAAHDPAGGPQRLLREAQAMARLAHPGVVAVYDVGVIGDRLFVAMEMIDGSDLRRWLAERPRGWREVVAAFLQAGAGLAAAHDAGIIHRDFKPDNVLVAATGRICVGDFGLAAAAADAPPRPSPALDDGASWLSTAGSMTRPGAVMGTPAYMAPEQMLGGEVTPAADLFAFCVALYEALYGQRPFQGDTIAALYLAIRRGHLAPPPAGLRLPRRLDRLLRRGLDPDPAARPPSMHAVLAELRALVEPRRRRWLGALAGVAAAAALAAALWPEPVTCARDDDAFAAIWTAERRAALERAFLAARVPHAPDTWARVAAAVDDLRAAWIDARQDACAAAHHRGDHSLAVLDLRAACLDRQRRDLDRLLTFLEEPDAKVIDNAVALVHGLDAPSACDPAEVVAAADDADALAPDPERDALREALAAARLLHRAGRYAAAIEALDPLVDRAAALGDPRLLARALTYRASAAYQDRRKDAGEWLLRAVEASIRAGNDRSFATNAGDLIGLHSADLAARDLWLRLAEAAIARHGGDDSVRAKVLNNYGNALRKTGDAPAALAAHREALALRRRSGDPPESVADSLYNVGAAVATLERIDEALLYFREATAIWRRELGPLHPRMLTALRNLAILAKMEGDNAAALAAANEALALVRTISPDDPTAIANMLALVGTVQNWQGDFDGALAALREAATLLESDPSRTPEHGREILFQLASYLVDAGDLSGAEAVLDRTLPVDLPEDHIDRLNDHLARLTIALARGDLAAADAALARGLVVLRGMQHRPALLVVLWLIPAAELDLRRGQIARGLTSIASARAEHAQGLKQPSLSARLAELRARLLLAAGRRAEARREAEAALADYALLGPGYEPRRAELRRLLADLAAP